MAEDISKPFHKHVGPHGPLYAPAVADGRASSDLSQEADRQRREFPFSHTGGETATGAGTLGHLAGRRKVFPFRNNYTRENPSCGVLD